jgi:lipoprotein NlpD
LILVLLLASLFTACGYNPASVEERSTYRASYKLTKDGHYRVRKGDSLHAIAFDFDLDWRDIANWNHIRSPYTIYPDQELRLSPPRQSASSAKSAASTSSSRSAGEPAPSSKTAQEPDRQGTATTTALKTPQATTTSKPSNNSAKTDPSRWLWPTKGRIISNFKANDPSRNGIEIGGKEGQAVVASAGGEVVYSGSGLIGYGELIIIKHSDRLLSAYAHNRKRLVSEGQKVTAGARIAEMGRNDRNQAILHFEIRVKGTPNDPLRYLPAR